MSTAQNWNQLTEFFRDLVIRHGWRLDAMVQLTQTISTSRYAAGLCATTSHASLLVAQNEESLSRRIDTLRVECAGETIHFEFREAAGGPVVWSKRSNAAKAFDVLEHFLRDVKHWWVDR